jgi:hypothetical protein
MCASTFRLCRDARPEGAQIAQLVEQGIENPRVGGSIPSLGTEFLERKEPPTSYCARFPKLDVLPAVWKVKAVPLESPIVKSPVLLA